MCEHSFALPLLLHNSEKSSSIIFFCHILQMTLAAAAATNAAAAPWTLVTPCQPPRLWDKPQVPLSTSNRVSVGGEMWPRPPESLTSTSHPLSTTHFMWSSSGQPLETTLTKEKVRRDAWLMHAAAAWFKPNANQQPLRKQWWIMQTAWQRIIQLFFFFFCCSLKIRN